MRLSSVGFLAVLRSVFMIVRPATYSSRFRSVLLLMVALCLAAVLVHPLAAQTVDAFGDSGADPVKLFERGQSAHARGDLVKALEYYDEAIKVRPEFPEAEFQRGNVLAALGRSAEAETSFRHAIELQKNWSLPYSALGALFARLSREKEAEPLLREAIRLDSRDLLATRVLANVRLKANDPKEALQLARRATADGEDGAAIWFVRALAERGTGDNRAALISLTHVLELEPQNFDALMERAEIRIGSGELEPGIADLKIAETLAKAEKKNLARIAAAYERAGNHEDGQRLAKAAGLMRLDGAEAGNVIGTAEEINLANSEDPVQSRNALEKLLKKNPDNTVLLARLGASYRTVDPSRSLALYRHALELNPANADFATGYSSALIQARRFTDAVVVLRKVVLTAPDNYAAHANLATALYELKQFPEALMQYEWLLQSKPDLTVAHYFIATAHDYLGEYRQALASYETFLAHADPNANQLEIEKVKLRLPSLRRQIQRGEGAKQKPGRSGKP
jgi:tetratricopeptide (TPR) repeat protein